MTVSAIHQAFGLTYAAYLVIPRSVLQDMPADWQARFVELLDGLPSTPEYSVLRRDAKGRFSPDPLANYRHPGPEVQELFDESGKP